MKIIDTHIHLNDSLNKTLDSKVAIVPAIKQTDWQKIIDLCKENKKIIPAFGIHPWYVDQTQKNWDQELDLLLQQHPQALIGETGLDRLKNKEFSPQNEFFATHINLAIKHNRAVIIHAVKCNEWLEKYWDKLKKIRFVFHSFNGKVELLNKVIKNGGYVSFSASILKNKEKEKILQTVPLDKILLETDGPYQKGDIKQTALEIANIIEIEYDNFLNIVYNNTIKFLD